MFTLLLRRIGSALPVLFIVGIIVFSLLRMTPGDPAAMVAGEGATAADIHRLHVELGLDKAIPMQFVSWATGVLRGELGYSYFYKMPIADLIAQRLGPTLSVALLTIVLTLLAAIPMGIVAAWKRGSWFDSAIMALSVAGLSIPVFVASYGLIWLLAMRWNIFPSQGFVSIADGVWPWLRSITLPCLTLAAMYCALIARVTRATVAEILTEDFIRTARAKGISELRLLWRHALPNAAVPIVTIVGLSTASLIGGVVITESVFAIPGLGQLTVDAVLSRDYPLIQGITLFFSLVYVVINLLVDSLYLLLDPRIRY